MEETQDPEDINLFNDTNIVDFMKHGRQSCSGQVIRMQEEEIPKKIL